MTAPPLWIFDLQHVGRDGGRHEGDLGAASDLDGDGRQETWEREALLTPRYVAAASQAAPDARCVTIAAGEYWERAEVVKDLAVTWRRAHGAAAPVAYVACHLNAGGGNYAAVFYGEPRGARLASTLAYTLSQLPGVAAGKALEASAAEWPGPWTTIRYVVAQAPTVAAVCLEPAFLDCPKHLPLLQGSQLELGRAIAAGLRGWSAERV